MSDNSKILIISDLHLADGTGTDDFSNLENSEDRETKLITFIEKHNPRLIIVNGDLYELWQTSMKKIRKVHSKILTFLENDPRVEIICGNHDFRLGWNLSSTIIANNQKRILITHGFQYEKRFLNPIRRFFVWILGKIELLIPRIENFFTQKKYLGKYSVEKVRKFAEERLKKNYDVVICGHSHHQELSKFGEKVYANSGTCQEGRLEGVLVDIITAEVNLVKD